MIRIVISQPSKFHFHSFFKVIVLPMEQKCSHFRTMENEKIKIIVKNCYFSGLTRNTGLLDLQGIPVFI